MVSWIGARKQRVGAATAAGAALALLVLGCDGQPSDERTSDRQTKASQTTGIAPARPQTCARPGVLVTGDIRGQATGATLWALPFEPLPFIAGHEVKIVWRMTGSGPPQFTVTGPSGEDESDVLRWGPEEHFGSSWRRPGDEWGTGFRFTDPGCWRITVRRSHGAGGIWVRVVDRT